MTEVEEAKTAQGASCKHDEQYDKAQGYQRVSQDF